MAMSFCLSVPSFVRQHRRPQEFLQGASIPLPFLSIPPLPSLPLFPPFSPALFTLPYPLHSVVRFPPFR